MKDIYIAELFKREGFKREKCKNCNRLFWTLNVERKTCGDNPCDEYAFIGKPPTKRRYTLHEIEQSFLKFFEKNGHKIIKRYPVVARWRDDIFLTIASIADFQPWVTSGLVPPPANPLVVSQPSIRLKDIDNVGRSGKHFTLFFMGGHHAFNTPRKKIYWNDETVELCHEFLTKELGIAQHEITYIQGFWEGGGNAGEDFEVNVRGLELATLVFMRYASKNGKYEPLPLNIVDTGYGLERFAWISQGTVSSYEAIFAPMINHLRNLTGLPMPPSNVLREHSNLAGMMDIETGRDLQSLRENVANRTGISAEEIERMMSPLEAIYAIADHLRCLAFMFGDGITPSNVKEGYLARLVLRRTLRLLQELGLENSLADLMALELEQLAKQFPELKERSKYVIEVIQLEERRYKEAIDRGKKLVERIATGLRSEGKPMPDDELIKLYDSHGLPPEVVREIASKLEVKVEIPEDFYIRVAKMHSTTRMEHLPIPPLQEVKLKKLPPTKMLYYNTPYAVEFEAKVLASSGKYLVLDKTLFYPEGGGQPGDIGELFIKNRNARVLDVQKVGETILHKLEPNIFKVGQHVRGKVDWARRVSLMRHHTATHVLVGAARRVLGDHVWQHGVQKGVDRTRLDISHFKRISQDDLKRIEKLANDVVMENRAVNASWMDRNEAEGKYGFDLYQGGVVPGKLVRVVDIENWNTQACAGTHCTRTGEIGLIKIVRTERIQDGVERIEFAAGDAALKFVQKQEELLDKTAEILHVPPERVAVATQQLFDQWKVAQKDVTRLQEQIARSRISDLESRAIKIGELRVVCEEIKDASTSELIQTASALTKSDDSIVAILGTRNEIANVVVMAGKNAVRSGVDSGKISARVAAVLGGGGGGKPEMGQGGGPRVEMLAEALEEAFKLIQQI